MSAVWLSPTRCALAVEEPIPSWNRVLRFDYSRVTRVSSTSCGSSNEPTVFAHFWFRQCRMVLRPLLSCLPSRFTLVKSLYWVLGLCGVSPGCCCVGAACMDDYCAGYSASLAQCCRCGSFSPVSRFFRASLGISVLSSEFSLLFLGYAYGVAFFAPSVYSPLISILQ